MFTPFADVPIGLSRVSCGWQDKSFDLSPRLDSLQKFGVVIPGDSAELVSHGTAVAGVPELAQEVFRIEGSRTEGQGFPVLRAFSGHG